MNPTRHTVRPSELQVGDIHYNHRMVAKVIHDISTTRVYYMDAGREGRGDAFVDYHDGNVIIVERYPEPRRLHCCCCGGVTQGRQWHNRDTGYGLCADCSNRLLPKYGEEEMVRLYGERGIHRCIPTDEDRWLAGISTDPKVANPAFMNNGQRWQRGWFVASCDADHGSVGASRNECSDPYWRAGYDSWNPKAEAEESRAADASEARLRAMGG